MANYCTKCGKELDSTEQSGHYQMSEYGIVCRECHEAAVIQKNSEKESQTVDKRVYDSYFTGAELVAAGVKTLLKGGGNKPGASGKVWIKYAKICQYVLWIAITLIGLVYGWNEGSWNGTGFTTALFCGAICFLIGFVTLAVTMIFISTAENIAVTTDMVVQILAEIKEKKD